MHKKASKNHVPQAVKRIKGEKYKKPVMNLTHLGS